MNKSVKENETLTAGRKFLSIQVLARRWNVSDSTVRRLIDEGQLKGIKIRRTYKILMDSVADFESRSQF
ncbi:MAG: hypothetical protein IEMM0002_0606 [bacterium]|nr:MAG: hypothetical protein IEMM0002_0606 [bacterium]